MKRRDFSKRLLGALALMLPATITAQAVVKTDRPSGIMSVPESVSNVLHPDEFIQKREGRHDLVFTTNFPLSLRLGMWLLDDYANAFMVVSKNHCDPKKLVITVIEPNYHKRMRRWKKNRGAGGTFVAYANAMQEKKK